jgi:hypothetical protein
MARRFEVYRTLGRRHRAAPFDDDEVFEIALRLNTLTDPSRCRQGAAARTSAQ